MKIKKILSVILITFVSTSAFAERKHVQHDSSEVIESQQDDNIKPKRKRFIGTGIASFYGREFQGRKTASGERYNMYAMTAAHNHLKFGTKVKVTCMATGKSVVVKINDTGSFGRKYNRSIDLSYAAAKALGIVEDGISKVRLDVVN